jgi:electron transport complex protein RnfB
MAGLGLLAAAMLTVASKFFFVKEDPRIALVAAALPGANCGGCGYAGCESFAAAVISDPNVKANLCCVNSAEGTAKVGELAGKAVAVSEPMMSVRRCEKNEGKVAPRHHYDGVATCAAAAELDGGKEACGYACLGFGDCVRVCPFNAMRMNDGMPQVLTLNCIGCNNCVKACPRSVLQLVPKTARVMVNCSTQDKLKAVTDICGVGCMSCLRCVKACPAQAVSAGADNRINIDHTKCREHGEACKEACVHSCPRGILRHMCKPAHEAKLEADRAKAAEKEAADKAKAAEAATKPAESAGTGA